MIFGSNGSRQWNMGGNTYNSDNNGLDATRNIGGDLFSFSGKRTFNNNENNTFTDAGNIQRIGDTWYANGKTYRKNGDQLYADGEVFTNIGHMTDDDIKNIILHDR